MRMLLLLVFMYFSRLSAQTLTAGAEYSNFNWEKLNNGAVNGKGWGRGLVFMFTRDLRPSLEAGISLSAGEYRENGIEKSVWGVSSYGRLQGQLLWSPVVALGKENPRYNLKITGGYAACYVPGLSEIGYKKVHADVSIGLRQTLQLGKYSGLFADLSHHQRLGADFKTMLCIRAGLLFRY